MKIKRILLSFLIIASVFCVVSCKNNGEKNPPETGKQPPVLEVTYDRTITRYAGERLGDVELLTVGNCTVGSLTWENPNELLVLGPKSYKWNFAPTNANKYNSVSGYLQITANTPLQDPQVSGVDYLRGAENPIYIDAPLSTVKFTDSYSSLIDGTLSWSNPNLILKSDAETGGVGNICTWLFTPSDNAWAKVSGTLIIHATEEQFLSSISAGPGTKTSGYVAFDIFDTSSLTIVLHYNADKVVTVENPQDYAIAYQNDKCLRQGDTFVQLQYLGRTCDINLETVGYKELDVPEFTEEVVYCGSSQLLQIQGSTEGYYDFEELWATDAGPYDLRVWLEYENDLKWKGTDETEVVVQCWIQESPHTITPVIFEGEYDGDAHSSTVSGEKVVAVYYSADVMLDASNYTKAGSTTAPTFVNADTYTVYYYAVGANNYLDMTGSIEFQIKKQVPNISLEYLYTLQKENANKKDNEIHYPSDYVTVTNKAGQEIPKGTLTFTYYQRYSENPSVEIPNILTQPVESGSENFGKAPTKHRDDVYYVLVQYAGDNANYAEAKAYTEFYIDVIDNGFYPLAGTDKFAFKANMSGDVSSSGYGHTITGTNSEECNAYIEFNKKVLDDYGLIELEFESKFTNVHGKVKSGKLVFEDGLYYLVYSDDSRVVVELSDDKTSLDVAFLNFGTIQLNKWEIPTFIDKTFSAQTIDSVTEGKNTSENTEISFYNDYGTIRFSAKVNTVYSYDERYDDESGGYETWAGVVTTNIVYNEGFWYTLTCYIMDNKSLESTGFNKQNVYFTFKWSVISKTPTSITLDGGTKIYGIYDCLKAEYSVA